MYSDPYEEWKAAGRPGGSFQAWQQQSAAPAPAAPAPAAPAAAQAPWGGGYGNANDMAAFQTWYGQQQGGNRPEDMDRFLQTDTLNRWNPYLVTSGANAGQYRSMRGAEGYFDKPTECPPGMYPSGPNETDPCVGGGGQQAPKQDAATAMGQGSQPAGQAGFLGGALSQALPQMMTQLQGQVSQSPASQPSAALGNMGGTLAPMMSSLQGLVGGQSQAASGAPKAGTMQTGWSSTAGGLQNMMAPLQKQKRVGSWF